MYAAAVYSLLADLIQKQFDLRVEISFVGRCIHDALYCIVRKPNNNIKSSYS